MKDINKVKVSILVPAFNVKAYLDECLQSLLSQSLKEIEIVVADDGFTDQTATACPNTKEYPMHGMFVWYKPKGNTYPLWIVMTPLLPLRWKNFITGQKQQIRTLFWEAYFIAIQTASKFV